MARNDHKNKDRPPPGDGDLKHPGVPEDADGNGAPDAMDQGDSPGMATRRREYTTQSDGRITEPLQGFDSSCVVDEVLLAARKQEDVSSKKAVENAILSTGGRKKRSSLPWPFGHDLWARIPTAWKALTIVIGIFASGASGYAALLAYTDKYATKDSLSEYRQEISDIRGELNSLRDRCISQERDLTATKKEMDLMREDVRTLLKHMLENPPARRGGKSR